MADYNRRNSSKRLEEKYNKHKTEESEDQKKIEVDGNRAVMSGALSAAIVFIGAYLVGEASGSEARILLQTTLNTTRSFCGTVTLSLGNILALMLTLLSLSASSDINLKWSHYKRVKHMAFFTTITLIGAILIYLLLNVPLERSETATNPRGVGYPIFYYTILAFASVLGGALISVVVMLFNTIKDTIEAIGHDGTGHRLVQSDEEE